MKERDRKSMRGKGRLHLENHYLKGLACLLLFSQPDRMKYCRNGQLLSIKLKILEQNCILCTVLLAFFFFHASQCLSEIHLLPSVETAAY